MQILGPALALIIIVAILANLLQTKPLFSAFPLKPDFNRLNPAQGLKKIFSRKTLFELLKVLLKLIAFALLILFGLNYFLSDIYSLSHVAKEAMGSAIVSAVVIAGSLLLAFFLPVVLLDKLFTTKDFSRQMRMSRREV